MELADAEGACAKTEAVRTWDGLFSLMFSPQGKEFCVGHNFPPIECFEEAKRKTENNVYVNAGEIKSENPANIAIIGRTKAEVVADDNKDICRIFAMHGAEVSVKASGYACVSINCTPDCKINVEQKDNSKIWHRIRHR